MKKIFLMFVVLYAGSVPAASGLSAYERGIVEGVAHSAYMLALHTLDTQNLNTGIEPFVCWPFPIEWDVFYAYAERDMESRLSAMSKKERKKATDQLRWMAWNSVYSLYGC